jgi:hypothetical protein
LCHEAEQLDAGADPIDKPSYNRGEIGIGIVHFGVGGFHRAHQAMYVDRLLEMGLAKDWGICGVGVLPSDRKMADVMAAQDGLYSLLLENQDGSPVELLQWLTKLKEPGTVGGLPVWVRTRKGGTLAERVPARLCAVRKSVVAAVVISPSDAPSVAT